MAKRTLKNFGCLHHKILKVRLVIMHERLNKVYFFHDGGPYYIETSPLICIANQWIGFYIAGSSVRKELGIKKENRFQGFKTSRLDNK